MNLIEGTGIRLSLLESIKKNLKENSPFEFKDLHLSNSKSNQTTYLNNFLGILSRT